jgi:hypothetical protein
MGQKAGHAGRRFWERHKANHRNCDRLLNNLFSKYCALSMQQVWLMDTYLHSLVVVLVSLWHIFLNECHEIWKINQRIITVVCWLRLKSRAASWSY